MASPEPPVYSLSPRVPRLTSLSLFSLISCHFSFLTDCDTTYVVDLIYDIPPFSLLVPRTLLFTQQILDSRLDFVNGREGGMKESMPGTSSDVPWCVSSSLGFNFTQLLPRECLGPCGLQYKSVWERRHLGLWLPFPPFLSVLLPSQMP